MGDRFVGPVRRLCGEYAPPGDKSISHRLALIGSVARGDTFIRNACPGEDFQSTLRCLGQLGAEIYRENGGVLVRGGGLYSLEGCSDVLDAGNSATTVRLLSGILAGQPFTSCLTGDDSLRNRPMRRIIVPLSLMGAQIEARKGNYPPVIIRGAPLHPIRYRLPLPSAQVKSSILLAGLYARGITEVIEPRPSRNHTEILLKSFGAAIAWKDGLIRIQGGHALRGIGEYYVPGDFSSASFIIVAALLLPDSDVIIRNINLNSSRTGLLDVILAMGGKVEILHEKEMGGERVGDIRIRHSTLKGIQIRRKIVGRMIDEIPLLGLLGACASGRTVVRHSKELRVKESDRIEGVVKNFREIGVSIEELADGFVIEGPQEIRGGVVDSQNDHRLAMMFAVAGLLSKEGVTIKNAECVTVSNPTFFRDLEALMDSG